MISNKQNITQISLSNVSRFLAVMIALSVLLTWGLVLNVYTGSVKIPTNEVLRMIWDAARYSVADFFTASGFIQELNGVLDASTESKIIFSIRMPRNLFTKGGEWMERAVPRIVLAGTSSGCGKTTVTCAVLQALVN